jgi:hypothetical protein
MNRTEILQYATKLINDDRQETHGRPEDSFANIANLWSAYLDTPIGIQEVPIMLALMKIARTKNNPNHIDNFIDLAGYAALGGELRSDNYDE